jgi:hypothetical protein
MTVIATPIYHAPRPRERRCWTAWNGTVRDRATNAVVAIALDEDGARRTAEWLNAGNGLGPVVSLAETRDFLGDEVEIAAASEAESRAREDHRAFAGKLLEVEWIYSSGHGDFKCELGRPFLVRVLPLREGGDLENWNDEHLDPYWDVEVVDGQGIIGDQENGNLLSDPDFWPWIYGRSYKLANTRT